MLTALVYLAQVDPPDGGGGDIVTIVYILTSISLIIGFIIGTWKYVQRQKQKWTNEGIVRQQQNQATAENTRQMRMNTEAVQELTLKFGQFATDMQSQMNDLGGRVGNLESWRNTSGR
jgi:uncharacterized protein HemX